MSSKKPTGKAQRSAIADVVAREYTIHMHKRVRFPTDRIEFTPAPDAGIQLRGC